MMNENGKTNEHRNRLDLPGSATNHSVDNPTSNFRPNASAHLCSVASVGFITLPVSNRVILRQRERPF
jgi:hypothetical protein